MKKAFGQTVRELKREVNKKVLKVPGIERKVLDATSNEPWGPHGTLLADIAQASRNYHEYQMIMAVLWRRINDTGKNWRHVYKALTVLDYLVAHGSERVIDEIKEHAYQISTLSEFQYIDSSGKDQGSNVRKKSQSIVALVNDKERIQEVRQKAATNRDKFRNSPVDGMHRPGPNSSPGNYGERYDDNQHEARYGNREDDRNGYGREREGGSRDDDQYSSRDGDRYSRDSDERYGRDGYRDNDYQGRGSTDDYQYNSRSRSSDRERERGYEDDGQYSSRGSGARADDRSQDGSYSDKGIDRKFSEQNLGGPPSYEEAVGDAHSPVQSERDGETAATFAPPANSTSLADPVSGAGPSSASPPAPSLDPASPAVPVPAPTNPVADSFDEFDPRGSFSALQTTSSGADMDFLGSLSESFSADPLAIMPITSATTASGVNELDSFGSGPALSATPSASNGTNQGFDDPFGDGPFRALPSADNVSGPPQNHNTQNVEAADFGDASSGFPHTPSNNPYSQFPSTNAQFSTQEPTTSNQDIDILADILPPLGGPSQVAPQSGFPVQTSQPAQVNGFQAQPDQSMSMVPFSVPAGQSAPQTSFPAQPNQPHFPGQPGQVPSMAGFQPQVGQSGPQTQFPAQSGHPTSQFGFPAQISQTQSHAGFSAQVSQPTPQAGFMGHAGHHAQYPAQTASLTGFPGQQNSAGQAGFPGQQNSAGQAGFPAPTHQPWQQGGNYSSSVQQTGYAAAAESHAVSQTAARPAQYNAANFPPQNNHAASVSSQSTALTLSGPAAQPNNDVMGNLFPSTTTGSSAVVSQPAKTKFEPKSAIWADTLSRGLVDFNISGSKVNPTNNLGIDFDAINRKEKRMEKPTATTTTVTSTINMGKAMGSGSGVGRAGAGALRASANPMMSPGMGMGMGMGGGPGVNMGMGGGRGVNMGMGGGPGVNMGMGGGPGVNMGMGGGPGVNMGMGGGPGANMGMGGYGGMNQPMGGGMNMPGMNMGMNQGMGMNMGMGQGPQMQPTGFPPGATMPSGYNPMMGRGGGYGPQQPYGGGFQ